VKIGLMIFPTATTMQPGELARQAEARGYESLWFPEHSHIPTSRRSPWGGGPGPLPEWYHAMYEQFTALAAAAEASSDIVLGTSITIVPQRDPIWLAKQVASIDHLSSGRFVFGVGYGWNREEYEDHGAPFRERRSRLRDCVLAMKAIWAEDAPAYQGEYVSFPSMWAKPAPVQRPHPPIVMGAEAGPRTAAHIAEFCDGWMPSGGPGLQQILDRGFEHIDKALVAAGRDRSELEVSIFAVKPERRVFDKLESMGVHRVLIWLPQGPRDEVLGALDLYLTLL
jgi:probable F420-dependent oxidoreductase